MNSRPRRSRPNKQEGPTIDLTAEDKTVARTPDEETSAEATRQAAPDPTPEEAASEPRPDVPDIEAGSPPIEPSESAAVERSAIEEAPAGSTSTEEPIPAQEPATDTTEELAGPREFAEDEGLQAPEAEAAPAADDGLTQADRDLILEAAHPHSAHEEPEHSTRPPFSGTPLSPAYEAAPHGGGFGPALGAGLLGAVIALAGAGVLQYAGVLPSVATEEAAPMDDVARKGDIQQLQNQIQDMKGGLDQVRSAQAAGGDTAAATSSRLQELDNRISAVEKGGGGQAAGDLDGLRQSVNEATNTANAANAAIEEVRQTATKANDTANQTASALDELRSTVDANRQNAENSVAEARQVADSANQTVAQLADRLSAVEAANAKARVALAAASLKAAIDRGDPFMSELETYAAAAGGDEAVADLRDFAAKGVPTERTFAAEWSDVKDRIAAALAPSGPNVGIGEQVLSGLKGLVSVRPAGNATTAAPAADVPVLAQMDQAMAEGNFRHWLELWQGLPDPGKAASQDFEEAVRSRIAADDVAEKALGGALGANQTAG
ncbi:COG4223 family protein [Consotaella salsifontis]|uniref:Uncharacterized conserved protein n=1 Tax=Consotaella salsifontis TaxID=1365950 RepID=A0A1T4QSZ5_9HYPH|nr:hypothetical protein [Consotaella salsifontis]SKA06408.1 Uncharacterized conserved protein [Consotaella salsifontis]